MSRRPRSSNYLRRRRQNRLLRELDHDPYHSKLKLKGPAACPDCGAVYREGRWTWGERPEQAEEHRCPACQRIHDKVPAAFLEISGDFTSKHRAEIEHLVENYEARERSEHPLKRIMTTERAEDSIVLSFTDAHLARGIGEALHSAYEGELDYQYEEGDIMLRVRWSR